MTETFLPKDYKVPSSGSFYTKFEEGTTKLRILSAPLLGWVDWKEENGKKAPVRFAYENKPEPLNPEKPVRHFWAFKVWNYKTNCVQVWEITQTGIQSEIQSYVNSEEWGVPTDYDINVIREGLGFNDTKYKVQALPPTEFPNQEEADGIKVDLSKLLVGLDPFGSEENDGSDII